ncbi:hypothetical protein M2138_000870 [Dysgonomonadaceae bacterium PH5-43]|nr:hypothetical protein [Dysgonomonadaceae bacterium PH5-43]
MKNKLIFSIIFLFGFITILNAQTGTEAAKKLRDYGAAEKDHGWTHSGVVGITFGQTSLSNWSAGGDNTVSGNFLLNGSMNYLKDKWFWDNSLALQYGLVYSSSDDWKKSSDKINLTSVAGRNISNKWSASFLLNFHTQFAKGYNYPDRENYLSKFMAPAYLDAALGFTYKPNANYSVFISPVTERATFVLDDKLSDAGAFGVDNGKKVKWETGAYLRATAKQTLWSDLSIISTLDMFTPYNDDFGNVNINWDLLLNYKLNKFLTATLNTTLRYYDTEVTKVQFKEVLGLGFTYNF